MLVPFRQSSLFLLLALVLNSDCALERIIGGRKIPIGDAPYQLSLSVTDPLARNPACLSRFQGEHICGAALVTQDTALTAAHCLLKRGVYSVRAGSTDVNKGGEIAYVKKAIVHPSFDEKINDYDLVILKLSKRLRFSEKIRAIRLPEQDESPPDGAKGQVTGWGSMSFSLGYYPDELRVVEVPILHRDSCMGTYRLINKITQRMFCAGYRDGGRDSCEGDSGGPFVINRTLYGLVSWGLYCAEPGYPGVYTNISALRTYIKLNANI